MAKHLLYDNNAPVICEREDWRTCPEHKHLTDRFEKREHKNVIEENETDFADDPNDDIISVNEYANVSSSDLNPDLEDDISTAEMRRDRYDRKFVNIETGEFENCDYTDSCTKHYHESNSTSINSPEFKEMSARAKSSLELPELPEGHFFELNEYKGNYSTMELELRKKTLLGSKIVKSSKIKYHNADPMDGSEVITPPKNAIEANAEYLYNEAFNNGDQSVRTKKTVDVPSRIMSASEVAYAYKYMKGKL